MASAMAASQTAAGPAGEPRLEPRCPARRSATLANFAGPAGLAVQTRQRSGPCGAAAAAAAAASPEPRMPGMTPTTADAEQGGRGERRKDGDAGKGGKEATCAPPAAPKNWRCAVPVVVSCFCAGSFNTPEGMSLSFSSSLIPQLQMPSSEVPITLDQGVLLASSMVISMAVGTLVAGLVMNRFGRLRTIQLCTLPFALGWFLIASASSYQQILVGRIFIGLANPLGINSAITFTTEVASGRIRMALNSTHAALGSLGIVSMYVLGAITDWRTSAWVCGTSPIIVLMLTFFFCHESPIWLVSKNRREEALRSLRAYARSNDSEDSRERLPERQLAYLEQRRAHLEEQAEHTMPWYRVVVALFTTPVGYKPLLILVCVFLAQNFSGVYISLFYAAPLFQEMGVKVDAFQAAVYVGITRFVCSTMTVFLLRGVGIRKPMLGSSFGMAVCMMLSGYFTLYPEKGMGGWVAVGFVLLYVAFSCCGMLTVPWSMTAELYPDHLRDVGQAVTTFISNSLMFTALHMYPILKDGLQHGIVKGVVGMQWFFAAVALVNVVFIIFFLPETHGKSLQEIEEHYQLNTLWLGRLKTSKVQPYAAPSLTALPPKDVEGGLGGVVLHRGTLCAPANAKHAVTDSWAAMAAPEVEISRL